MFAQANIKLSFLPTSNFNLFSDIFTILYEAHHLNTLKGLTEGTIHIYLTSLILQINRLNSS